MITNATTWQELADMLYDNPGMEVGAEELRLLYSDKEEVPNSVYEIDLPLPSAIKEQRYRLVETFCRYCNPAFGGCTISGFGECAFVHHGCMGEHCCVELSWIEECITYGRK